MKAFLLAHGHKFAAHGHEYVALVAPLIVERQVFSTLVFSVAFVFFVFKYAEGAKAHKGKGRK